MIGRILSAWNSLVREILISVLDQEQLLSRQRSKLSGESSKSEIETNSTQPSRSELLEIYKEHLEEVRFQTKFNWDRTQYFLVLNLGTLGVSATLWNNEKGYPALLILALFLAGMIMSFMSIAAMRQGHKYYRKAVLQKTRVEHLLGLTSVDRGDAGPPIDISSASTPGKEEAQEMIAEPQKYLDRPLLRFGQIGFHVQAFFLFIATVNFVGVLMVMFELIPGLSWFWFSLKQLSR